MIDSERTGIPKIELRPDQLQGISAIRESYKRGSKAPLFVAPTGFGKTICFCHICLEVSRRGKRVFLLVHRQELLDQVSRTLNLFDVPHSFIAPGYHYDARCPVQVASVFALGRRLNKIKAPDLVIVDECHHASGKSIWGKILTEYPSALRLGVTATPTRLSGEPLSDLFDDLVLGPTVRELIDAGNLSDYKIYAPTTVSTSGLHTNMGDFVQSELSELMDKPKITGDAVSQYKKFADGTRAVAFCVSIEHAQHVAHEFETAGYRARSLDGTMDPVERRVTVQDFKDGTTQILTSCQILSEGFDVPAIQTGIFLRPTQSLVLFLQQVGRCLRSFPSKPHALLLDHVGHCARFGLPDDPREWSLEGHSKAKRKKKDETETTKICPSCFIVVRRVSRTCPECEHIFEITPREVDQIAGELQELDASTLRRTRAFEQSQAQDFQSLVRIGKARGIKNAVGWAHIILNSRKKKEQARAQKHAITNSQSWLEF